ncbi:hypothetical protein VE00_11167 [Pseudogymnoascus sp. WSF 3629]|nr:hypothetical protein VE00_11167 [Pseudogymnoascus sp. WSF 3629]
MTDEFSKLTKGNLELEAYLNNEAKARDEEDKDEDVLDKAKGVLEDFKKSFYNVLTSLKNINKDN